MSFGVRVLVCVAAYGIVGWLVILGLAAGDPWMVGLSVGLLLPLVPRAWRRRTAIAFLAYVLAAGVIGPMWAWMGVLLFVPLYLEAPRPGLVFGAAMTLVLFGMSVQQQGELREREERQRELLVESGNIR
jgi:hypothetical protein